MQLAMTTILGFHRNRHVYKGALIMIKRQEYIMGITWDIH